MYKNLFYRLTRRNPGSFSRDVLLYLYIACQYCNPGGGFFHTLPIRVCAAQRGRHFEAPDLERGIHFRGVFNSGTGYKKLWIRALFSA